MQTLETLSKPVFILGCGRSGTTIFGMALSVHDMVAYLDERRDLWALAYPETDIWSEYKEARKGRIVLTQADEVREKSQILKKLFEQQLIEKNAKTLVEKLPINNFRLGLINAIFPDACYIHIYRNALEVARSIEVRCNNGKWFANNEYKWNELVKIARSKHETEHLPDLCSSFYDKGLLEWRLSTDTLASFLDQLPNERQYELSYAELTQNPDETVCRALEFLGLDMQPLVKRFCQEVIRRKTVKLDMVSLTDSELQIGGRFLKRSMVQAGSSDDSAFERQMTFL